MHTETKQERNTGGGISIIILIIYNGISGCIVLCVICCLLCIHCPCKKYNRNARHHRQSYTISDILDLEYNTSTTPECPDTDDHQTSPQEFKNQSLLLNTSYPILNQCKFECLHKKGTNSNDVQQMEDFTNSHETQISLSTSGPPIDPNMCTREYIPESFTPVTTLSHCTHDGRRIYDEHNDFGLDIPVGAIPYGVTITIDISVALYGLFQYPEGLRPVSPVFWICVRDQRDFNFLKPVKVTIPHCLNLESHDDIESLGLTFLKGDHEMNSEQMCQFQQARRNIFIEPLKRRGLFKTTHFCSLCIACKDTMKFIKKAAFCIYSVIPRVTYSDQPSDAYFFISFMLKTCLTTVQKQIMKLNLQEHEEEKEKFQFSNTKALKIVISQTAPDGWMIGMHGKKKVVQAFIIFNYML